MSPVGRFLAQIGYWNWMGYLEGAPRVNSLLLVSSRPRPSLAQANLSPPGSWAYQVDPARSFPLPLCLQHFL